MMNVMRVGGVRRKYGYRDVGMYCIWRFEGLYEPDASEF
jgi:hypothetical protein